MLHRVTRNQRSNEREKRYGNRNCIREIIEEEEEEEEGEDEVVKKRERGSFREFPSSDEEVARFPGNGTDRTDHREARPGS